MTKDVGTTILMLLVLSPIPLGCATARFGVEKYEAALRLEVRPRESRGKVGDSITVDQLLKNISSGTVEGCLSEGKGYNFYLPGGQARGSANLIDHPGCVRRFRLEPAGSIEWVDEIQVIDVGAGQGEFNVWVGVSDPTRCDEYGCDDVNIRSEFVPFEIMGGDARAER